MQTVTFYSQQEIKCSVSRDLVKVFESRKMSWIANNVCDAVNYKNNLYLSYFNGLQNF